MSLEPRPGRRWLYRRWASARPPTLRSDLKASPRFPVPRLTSIAGEHPPRALFGELWRNGVPRGLLCTCKCLTAT